MARLGHSELKTFSEALLELYSPGPYADSQSAAPMARTARKAGKIIEVLTFPKQALNNVDKIRGRGFLGTTRLRLLAMSEDNFGLCS